MGFFRQVLVMAAKDLRAELRTKEAINASLAFALVILLLFSFAFDPTEETTREISGGLLWIVFAFAGALVLNRSFARELPNDCLDALIAAPISGAALFLGKAIANFLLVLAVARAFLHDPSVLLLDEPFTALDDRAIAVLQTLLRQALADGKTIILSTHQLREALELASHVALLNRGQAAFWGPSTPEMVADPGLIYARYGEG